MSVFSSGLSVVENNVANRARRATVKQDVLLVALRSIYRADSGRRAGRITQPAFRRFWNKRCETRMNNGRAVEKASDLDRWRRCLI